MSGKRIKKDKLNIKKLIFIIVILIIILVGIAIALIKINKDNENNNNSVSENTENSGIVMPKPEIRAYFEDTKDSETIKDGSIYHKNFMAYSSEGKIESIIHNGAPYEGTKLNDEGAYVITMKPDDGTDNITVTVTIDTQIPTVLINDSIIIKRKLYRAGAKVTLKDEKGLNKISKALLVSCNGNYEVDTNVEPIDITSDLKNQGYEIKEKGIYEIQLLDENNNKIEFNGKEKGFRVI